MVWLWRQGLSFLSILDFWDIHFPTQKSRIDRLSWKSWQQEKGERLVSCSLTPLGHHFKTQEEFAQFCLVAKLVLDCFRWPSKNCHSAAWPCHSHCWTRVKGFVHPTSVIMDARRHKKVWQFVCELWAGDTRFHTGAMQQLLLSPRAVLG